MGLVRTSSHDAAERSTWSIGCRPAGSEPYIADRRREQVRRDHARGCRYAEALTDRWLGPDRRSEAPAARPAAVRPPWIEQMAPRLHGW